jgi:exonuclease I
MPFVFYDTETSGTNTAFDQVVQFAAVRTDDQCPGFSAPRRCIFISIRAQMGPMVGSLLVIKEPLPMNCLIAR